MKSKKINFLRVSSCSKCLSGKIVILLFLFSCTQKQHVDLIVHNAIVYTVDSTMSTAESFAIKDGKFIAIGSNDEILNKYETKEIIDAKGKAIYPGFIDSHCHFYGYGVDLKKINLYGTKSFDEIISILINQQTNLFSNWIFARGWDQNDWTKKEYPDKSKLDSLFPNTPVFLMRVDGHAVLVNQKALDLAKITIKTKINGGEIILKNGKLTGLLIDNAVDSVKKLIVEPSRKDEIEALLSAQKNCFEVGLTTVDDAGINYNTTILMDSLQKINLLKMRIYAMLTPNEENENHYLKQGIYKTEKLNICSFKFYADGALGSRGALLLNDYSDKKNHKGLLLNEQNYFVEMAKKMSENKFQMNTHCIGDSAVRLMLNIYKNNSSDKNNRWRIEHFQVTTLQDIVALKNAGLIPSVQPTHATSDMYWAKERLGEERMKYAYAYNDLLKVAGMITLGTDFPVEDINPLYTFYAAVARKDLKGFPKDGFQMENALSRENTLRGMTIWGAFANFEETEKGSIEVGKFADFIILENDIMKCEIDKVPTTKVVSTFLNGEKVFQKN